MKKTTLVTLGMTTTIISTLLLGSLTVSAAPVTAKSTGEATFEADTNNWDVVKPGTDVKIEPENPTTQVKDGGVRLMHVPNFNFGQNSTSVNEANHPVKLNRFNKKGDADMIGMPQFTQVGDGSGKVGTKWEVTAEQDTVFTSNDADAHELTASRIRLFGATATNNQRNSSVANMVDIVSIPTAGGHTNIPVKTKDGGPLAVLTSKNATGADSTNNTISSVVFMDAYDETNFVATEVANVNDRAENADVKLNIPSSDSVQVKPYKADITWTLTVTP